MQKSSTGASVQNDETTATKESAGGGGKKPRSEDGRGERSRSNENIGVETVFGIIFA